MNTKRYCVHSRVTLGVFTDVAAESPEQAKELASLRGIRALCTQCSHSDGDERSEWCLLLRVNRSLRGAITRMKRAKP